MSQTIEEAPIVCSVASPSDLGTLREVSSPEIPDDLRTFLIDSLSIRSPASETDQSPSPNQRGFFDPENAPTSEKRQLVSLVTKLFTVQGAPVLSELRVPVENLGNPSIIAMFGGLGADFRHMRDLATTLAALGSPTLLCAPIGKSDRSAKSKILDASGLYVNTLTEALQQLASDPEVKNVPNGDKLSFEQINLAAHSHGGVSAINYALDNLDSIMNVILIQWVGGEEAKPLRFGRRLARFAVREVLVPLARRELSIGNVFSSGKSLARDIPQTIGKVFECLFTDNRQRLTILRGAGINYAIITGDDDSLIPDEAQDQEALLGADDYRRLAMGHLGVMTKQEELARQIADCIGFMDRCTALEKAS